MDLKVVPLAVDGVFGGRVEVELSCLELDSLGFEQRLTQEGLEIVLSLLSLVNFNLLSILHPAQFKVFEQVVVLGFDEVGLCIEPRAVSKAIGAKWLDQVDWTLVILVIRAEVDLTLAWHQVFPVRPVVSIEVISHVWNWLDCICCSRGSTSAGISVFGRRKSILGQN